MAKPENSQSEDLKQQIQEAMATASLEQLAQAAEVFGIQTEVRDQVQEQVAEDPLTRYHEHYERWESADRARISWAEVEWRLLASERFNLKKAASMQDGGLLFGVDKAGRPLVADGGLEPIMKGMDYFETRKAVRGTKQDPSGFEMFPYKEPHPYSKSPEILAFEKFTGQPFVKSEDGKEWRAAWLESGANPRVTRQFLFDRKDGTTFPRLVYFNPKDGTTVVGSCLPHVTHETRGVRRLLRLEETWPKAFLDSFGRNLNG